MADMEGQVVESDEELQLSLEEAEADLKEALAQRKAALADKLSGLAGSLETKVQERIAERGIVEERWLEDTRQFHGYYGSYYDPDQPFEGRDVPRKPKVNITRQKCNVAIGQVADLQFPGRDKNFRFKHTAEPDLARGAEDTTPAAPDPQTGEQVTKGAQFKVILEEARKRASGMERTIWDQLSEANWGAECRDAIKDLVVLGTAVIKGPMVEGRVRKKWVTETNTDGASIATFEYEVEKKPTAHRVDPWYFYPDMRAKKASEASDSFELHPMTHRDLIRLSEHPAFDREAISDLKDEEPNDIVASHVTARHAITGQDTYFKSRYQVWEYHGHLDDQLIEMLGLDDADARNPLSGYFGEVWFCQGHVLKVRLTNMVGDVDIPYCYTQWEADETTPFGFGIPFLVRDAQRVVNSTYRMILDNAGLSAGPQCIINQEMIEPYNGEWDIQPMKVWLATEYGVDPDKAMTFFDVPSNVNELADVLQLAMSFADAESNMPLISQGIESAQGTTTAIGMTILDTNSNVVQKRVNKSWDDDITVCIGEKFYHWNMLYNDDDSIKGDYDIIALGSTDLMNRQMETQDAAMVLQAATQNPALADELIMNELARTVITSTRVDADSIVKTPEQSARDKQAREENRPPDFETLEIQLKQARLDFEKQKFAAEMQQKDADRQLKAMSIQNEYEQWIAQAQAKVIAEQNEREQALIKLAQEDGMSVRQLLADVGMHKKSEETKALLAATDFAKHKAEMAARIANMNSKPTGYDSFG